MSDSQKSMENNFSLTTGQAPGKIMRMFFGAIGSLIDTIKRDIDWHKDQAFWSLCSIDALYLHTAKLYPPIPPEYAVGSVIFFGDVDAVIPVGTTIIDGDLLYKTTNEGVIYKEEYTATPSVLDRLVTLPPDPDLPSCVCTLNGREIVITSTYNGITFVSDDVVDGVDITLVINKSDKVGVIAEELGSDKNKFFDDSLNVKLLGIKNEVKVLTLDGGKDEETDEAYRARVLYLRNNPRASFSKSDIIYNLSQVHGIKRVWVESGNFGEKKLTILAINNNYTLTDKNKKDLTDKLNTIKQVNLEDFEVPIIAPTVESLDVVIEDMLPALEEMRNVVRLNITDFFDTANSLDNGISKGELQSLIFHSTYLHQEVFAFVLSNGWADKKYRTYFKLGSITFE